HFFDRLLAAGRARAIGLGNGPAWIAMERIGDARLLWPEISVIEGDLKAPVVGRQVSRDTPGASDGAFSKDSVVCHGEGSATACLKIAGNEDRVGMVFSPRAAATTRLTQGWLQIVGPTTSSHLAAITHL